MSNRNTLPLSTSQSRQDLGAVLMIIGFIVLILPIIGFFVTQGGSSLTFITTFGFIGLAFFVSGSILVTSVPTID